MSTSRTSFGEELEAQIENEIEIEKEMEAEIEKEIEKAFAQHLVEEYEKELKELKELKEEKEKHTIRYQRMKMFDYLDIGDRYYAHQKYKGAMIAFREAASRCSKTNTRSYTAALINVKIALTNIACAAVHQSRALSLDPNRLRNQANDVLDSVTSDINHYKSNNRLNHPKKQKKIQDKVMRYFYFKDAIRHNTEKQRNYLNAATQCLKSALKQFESNDRVRDHEKQIKLIEMTNAYFTLASTYLSKNKIKKALKYSLEKGLVLNKTITNPDNQLSYADYQRELTGVYTVINCFQELQQYKNAIPYYKRAIAIYKKLEEMTQQASPQIPQLELLLKQARLSNVQNRKYKPYKKSKKLKRVLSAENDSHSAESPQSPIQPENQPFSLAPTAYSSLLRYSVLTSDSNKRQKTEMDPSSSNLFNFKLER